MSEREGTGRLSRWRIFVSEAREALNPNVAHGGPACAGSVPIVQMQYRMCIFPSPGGSVLADVARRKPSGWQLRMIETAGEEGMHPIRGRPRDIWWRGLHWQFSFFLLFRLTLYRLRGCTSKFLHQNVTLVLLHDPIPTSFLFSHEKKVVSSVGDSACSRPRPSKKPHP